MRIVSTLIRLEITAGAGVGFERRSAVDEELLEAGVGGFFEEVVE
jgi:hypothetical protein